MKYYKELVLSISCLLLAFLLTMIWIQQRDENMAAGISPEILRFHVLANSNSNEDQELKLEVKSLLIDTINKGLPEHAGKEETCTYIEEHQSELEQTAEAYMKRAGFDYKASVALTNCYFPTKAYGDVVLPCGNYDAARVTIGSGRGRNWWCVLYPQLCFVNASYGVVPEESKELLREALTPEEYDSILDTRNTKLKVQVRFKLLDMLEDMIEHAGNGSPDGAAVSDTDYSILSIPLTPHS